MSSHNEKPDQIWVDKTFTAVVDTAVVEPLFTVTVWADSPPPSVTPISLADIFDPYDDRTTPDRAYRRNMTDQDAESSCSLEKPLALRLGQAEDSNDRSQTATVDDDNPPDDPGHERTSRDDSNDDDDSTFGEATSSTTSKLVEEDPLVIRGRKHRSMVQGVHPWIPNDEKQRDVMDIKHYVATNLFDGALYQAPLTENIQGVLDVGTGTGLWAIDFADKYPHASVIGIDLFPIQPTWVPPNLRL
ncbi:hypothetical protein ACJ41O_005999 [Fusarium nematophilum]